MTAPRQRSLRPVAVAALLTFGCAVVRAPAAGMAEPVPVKEGTADPQLALWVEGGKAPTPAETDEAAARARAALSEAARGLEAPGGDLLVVRAQGVTRTKGRRANQVAGAVGAVVGVAVVVVVAIVALTQGKGSGPKSAPAGSAVKPGGSASRVRHAPVPGRGPRVRPAPLPGTAPRLPHDGVVVWGEPTIQWGIWFDVSGPVRIPPPADVGFPQPVASYGAMPPSPLAAGATEGLSDDDEIAFEPEPAPVSEVHLGPPAPLPLEQRGFFAGDDMLVELVAVDRMTGEPRLRKVARRSIDPTDAAEVRKFLRRALVEGAWEPVPAAPGSP
jgi:hypothetical protein